MLHHFLFGIGLLILLVLACVEAWSKVRQLSIDARAAQPDAMRKDAWKKANERPDRS